MKRYAEATPTIPTSATSRSSSRPRRPPLTSRERPMPRRIHAGKGRPTPKRREARPKKRGPVAPAPLTPRKPAPPQGQSRQQGRSARPRPPSAAPSSANRRARMLAGEEKYLLPRDKGPVRAYTRDLV
ncbi:DUF3043 domain-containing protein, partial [Rhodococcus hoagii]|nr:DUF3043 domain-containing protein [Prescottella equi]